MERGEVHIRSLSHRDRSLPRANTWGGKGEQPEESSSEEKANRRIRNQRRIRTERCSVGGEAKVFECSSAVWCLSLRLSWKKETDDHIKCKTGLIENLSITGTMRLKREECLYSWENKKEQSVCWYG